MTSHLAGAEPAEPAEPRPASAPAGHSTRGSLLTQPGTAAALLLHKHCLDSRASCSEPGARDSERDCCSLPCRVGYPPRSLSSLLEDAVVAEGCSGSPRTLPALLETADCVLDKAECSSPAADCYTLVARSISFEDADWSADALTSRSSHSDKGQAGAAALSASTCSGCSSTDRCAACAEADSAAVTGAAWPQLLDDLMKGILAKLPPSYVRVLRLVCRGWRASVGRAVVQLRPEAVPASLPEHFPHLRHLDLSVCHATVVNHKQDELRLCSVLSDAQLAPLAALVHLRSLSLRGCAALNGSGLVHLAGMRQLASLDLSGCAGLLAGSLAPLAGLPRLAALDLRGCRLLTDADLAGLAPLHGLRRLSLGACPLVTNGGLEAVARLGGLRRLALVGCGPGVTDQGLAFLLGLPRLAHLTTRACPGLTPRGVAALRQLKRLPPDTGLPHAGLPARTSAWVSTVLADLDLLLADL